MVSTSAEVGNEVSKCIGTCSECLKCDISHVKCVDSGECNPEANKMSAETQLTHQLIHRSLNGMTAEVAVMKGHAGKTKPELVTTQGIISDPEIHDTIVDTCENKSKFGSWVVMNFRLKMHKVSLDIMYFGKR